MAIIKHIIPKYSIERTAFRVLGTVGAIFTSFQSVVWLVLSVGGVVCTYTGCGSQAHKSSFQYCFYLYYFHKVQNETSRINLVTPPFFQGIMWLHAVMCLINVVISLFTAKVFITWKHPKIIQKTACLWTTSILIFSVVELITCIIFFYDIVTIKQKDEAKCFLEKNLNLLLSSKTVVHGPAPYLLKLKSNLKMMQKKIKKLKRNLLFLDAVLDEENCNNRDNPFTYNGILDSFVEDIWHEMFNSNIRNKVRRKSGMLPFDEELRNLIINEHLSLDDIDYDLLTNFDSLTNYDWIKPIENSNVVIGKEFNLSTSILVDNSTKLEKIANFLQEYIKHTRMKNNTDYTITDKQFGVILKTLLNEFEEEDTYIAHDKRKFNINEDIVPDDDENIALNLKIVFENLDPKDILQILISIDEMLRNSHKDKPQSREKYESTTTISTKGTKHIKNKDFTRTHPTFTSEMTKFTKKSKNKDLAIVHSIHQTTTISERNFENTENRSPTNTHQNKNLHPRLKNTATKSNSSTENTRNKSYRTIHPINNILSTTKAMEPKSTKHTENIKNKHHTNTQHSKELHSTKRTTTPNYIKNTKNTAEKGTKIVPTERIHPVTKKTLPKSTKSTETTKNKGHTNIHPLKELHSTKITTSLRNIKTVDLINILRKYFLTTAQTPKRTRKSTVTEIIKSSKNTDIKGLNTHSKTTQAPKSTKNIENTKNKGHTNTHSTNNLHSRTKSTAPINTENIKNKERKKGTTRNEILDIEKIAATRIPKNTKNIKTKGHTSMTEASNFRKFMVSKEDCLRDEKKPQRRVNRRKNNAPKSNDYIKELCEHCGYLVLSPSIFCMIMSVKTGLVWVLNVILAILVWYYGTKAKIGGKYMLWPCNWL